MNLGLVIFGWLLAFGAGYCFGLDQDECPREILGYKCKGDFCNHSRAEIDKAKEEVQQTPSNWKYRP